MTKTAAFKVLRRLLVDHRAKVVYLPMTVLSDAATAAVCVLEEHGYRTADSWGNAR